MSFVAISVGTAGVSVLGGLAQTIFSGKRKAQKNLQSALSANPQYGGSKPIGDYYNEALNRYNVSPYQSSQYQMAKQNAERGTATGLNALQGRGQALAGASRLVGLQNDAELKAGAMAENDRNQRFSQLGGATSMKAGDDRYKFQNNQVDPYNRNLQYAGMQASAANARSDAGLNNIFGGLSNIGMLGASGALKGLGKTKIKPINRNPFFGQDVQTNTGVVPNVTTNINTNGYNSLFGG